jgi:hypothetical protein
MPGAKSTSKTAAPVTVNQDILRAAGLVRTLQKPLKILGGGELSTALFVVADRFTKSAIVKIEAAGGTVSMLEIPKAPRPALGVDRPSGVATDTKPAKKKKRAADDDEEDSASAAEPTEADSEPSASKGGTAVAEAPRTPKPKRPQKAAKPAADTASGAEGGASADEAAPAGDN